MTYSLRPLRLSDAASHTRSILLSPTVMRGVEGVDGFVASYLICFVIGLASGVQFPKSSAIHMRIVLVSSVELQPFLVAILKPRTFANKMESYIEVWPHEIFTLPFPTETPMPESETLAKEKFTSELFVSLGAKMVALEGPLRSIFRVIDAAVSLLPAASVEK